jgi:tetratricopeptide (TPR) repeat protein
MGQQASPELHAAPAGEATSDVSSHDINSPPAEPPPHSQAPLTEKQAEYPSQAEASDDEGVPQAPPLPKVRLHRQKPESATDVRVAGEQAGLRAQKVERSSSGREAEVKEKIVIGWFFIERKDYRAAIQSLTEALEIDPSNLEAQSALRVARYASQNSDVKVLPSNPPSLGDGATKRSQ